MDGWIDRHLVQEATPDILAKNMVFMSPFRDKPDCCDTSPSCTSSSYLNDRHVSKSADFYCIYIYFFSSVCRVHIAN